MSPDIFQKWEHIVNEVDKTRVPVEFIKKLIIKLEGRRQRTINIRSLFNQGLESEDIETVVLKKLEEYDQNMVGIEFILDIEKIAQVVQPETDELLHKL